MKDAVTIVVVHVSRQHDQSLLNIRQDLRLKAGPDPLRCGDLDAILASHNILGLESNGHRNGTGFVANLTCSEER